MNARFMTSTFSSFSAAQTHAHCNEPYFTLFFFRFFLFSEHVDIDEAKSIYETNYSHVYFILYDTFVQAETNLKQKGWYIWRRMPRYVSLYTTHTHISVCDFCFSFTRASIY